MRRTWTQIKNETMTKDEQQAAHRLAMRDLAEMELAELRETLRVSQQELARKLKVTQAAVSRLERRPNLLLESIANYIEARTARGTSQSNGQAHPPACLRREKPPRPRFKEDIAKHEPSHVEWCLTGGAPCVASRPRIRHGRGRYQGLSELTGGGIADPESPPVGPLDTKQRGDSIQSDIKRGQMRRPNRAEPRLARLIQMTMQSRIAMVRRELPRNWAVRPLRGGLDLGENLCHLPPSQRVCQGKVLHTRAG